MNTIQYGSAIGDQSAAIDHALEVKETDTIKAMYAPMPMMGLSVDYLVEVTEPIKLVPFVRSISVAQLSAMPIGSSTHAALKEILLKEWHDHFKMQDPELLKDCQWVTKVDKVELILCDLLVPKKSVT